MDDNQDMARESFRKNYLKRWGTGLDDHYAKPYWVEQKPLETREMASDLSALRRAAHLPVTNRAAEEICQAAKESSKSKVGQEVDPFRRSGLDEDDHFCKAVQRRSNSLTIPHSLATQGTGRDIRSRIARTSDSAADAPGECLSRPWVLVAPQIEEAISTFSHRAGRTPDDEEIAQCMGSGMDVSDLYRMLSLMSGCALVTVASAREAPEDGPGSVEWLSKRDNDQQWLCLSYEMQEMFSETVHYVPPSEPLRILFRYWSSSNEERVLLSFAMSTQEEHQRSADVSIHSIIPYEDQHGLFDPQPHILTRSTLDGSLPRGPFWDLFGDTTSFSRHSSSSYWFKSDLTVAYRQRQDRYCFNITSDKHGVKWPEW